MTLTQQQYTDARAWLIDPRAQPISPLPEYAQLTGAIGALKPAVMVRPTVHTVPLDLTQIVALAVEYDAIAEYDRFLDHAEFKVAVMKGVPFFRADITAGGGHANPLAYPRYGLLARALLPDGSLSAPVDVATACSVTTFRGLVDLDWSKLPFDGCPVQVQITPYDASGARAVGTECYVPFVVYVNRNGAAKDFPLYIAQNGSFDWTHPGFASYEVARAVPRVYQWAAIPVAWLADQPTFPLTPKVAQIPAGNSGAGLTRVNLALGCDADAMNPFWPRKTRSGIYATGASEGYFWSDLVTQEFPPFDELDGPRRPQMLHYPLHAWASGRPDIIARKVYGGTKHRMLKISPDGTVTTLFGLRNKDNQPRYRTFHSGNNDIYDEPPTLADFEIVGQDAWDPSVPLNERRPDEPWFSCFNPATVTLNMGVPPVTDSVTPPPGEQPHNVGPQLMVGSRQYLLLATFQPDMHGPPVSIKRILAGNDFWGGSVWTRTGNVIVAERSAHRLLEVDWTGKVVRVVLEDAAAARFGVINPYDRTWAYTPPNDYTTINSGKAAAAVRAGSKICGPEGVWVMDDWAYFSSYAMAAIYRVHLVTGQVQLVGLPHMDWLRQSHFIQICVSDGTIFPRHTVIATTHAIDNNGVPAMFGEQPGLSAFGEPITHAANMNNWHTFAYDVGNGAGGYSYGGIYPTACYIGNGTILTGGSQPGLAMWVKSEATDVKPDKVRLVAGARAWRAAGDDLIWSREGFAPHKLPLPWGENPDKDAWLTNLGHVRGAP